MEGKEDSSDIDDSPRNNNNLAMPKNKQMKPRMKRSAQIVLEEDESLALQVQSSLEE